jgi:cardiolipin synthase
LVTILPNEIEPAWYALEWIIRIGALAVVPLRRTPAATRSWLLLIFFLPVPGLLLFLVIGSPRFPRARRTRFEAMKPFIADVAARVGRLGATGCRGSEAIAELAKNLGGYPAVDGNDVELIDDYDEGIDRLIADIDAAERWVHLLSYIFADDAVAQKVVAALARAVKRGVRCRVMLDPIGSLPWRRRALKMLAEAGVETRKALPFHLIRGRTRRDMRNHRKLFVIDGRIGYAGSQNIIAKNFRKGVTNRELIARVRGPVVAEMTAVVEVDWCIESEDEVCEPIEIPARAGDDCAQLLPSGAEYRLQGFETLLVWQLHQARERAVIVTPYFVPDEDVVTAMRIAVARNVEVDVIVSAVVDQRLVNLAQRSYYEELLSAGVRIHCYRDFLLHAKNVAIDGRLAILGSSNVDIRSFQLNDEVSLLLFDAESVARVEAVQRGYIAASDEIDLEAWRARPRIERFAENIARMLGPLL